MLEQGGFAGFGGGDDEAALASADGGEHVYEAGGYEAFGGFKGDLVGGEYGGEGFEVSAAACAVGDGFVDFFNADEAEVALAVFGGADLAADVVAGTQAKAAYLGLGDVDVVVAADAVAGLAQKAVAVVEDVEDAACFEAAVFVGHIGEDSGHHFLAARHRAVVHDAKFLRQFEEFFVV